MHKGPSVSSQAGDRFSEFHPGHNECHEDPACVIAYTLRVRTRNAWPVARYLFDFQLVLRRATRPIGTHRGQAIFQFGWILPVLRWGIRGGTCAIAARLRTLLVNTGRVLPGRGAAVKSQYHRDPRHQCGVQFTHRGLHRQRPCIRNATAVPYFRTHVTNSFHGQTAQLCGWNRCEIQ